MPKSIGVICDLWKTKKFRDRLTKEKFTLTSEKIYGQITTFTLEVEDDNFINEQKRLSRVLTQLEIEIKQSN